MKLEIIYTEDYILAVSDEDVKEDTLFTDDNKIFKCRNIFENGVEDDDGLLHKTQNCKKLVAHLPLNNAPKLKGVPLLPEIVVEDDVEKLAESYADFSNDYISMSFGTKFNETSKRDFIAGYKAATKRYSEEDLRKSFEAGMYFVGEDKGSYEEFIQSLKQLPKYFVAKMETTKSEVFRENDNVPYALLKTTTIQGQLYLSGHYVYEK